MSSAPEFHAWSSSHLIVIFLTIVLPFVLALVVRRAFRNHYRHRVPDADLRISSEIDWRVAHVCLDGNVFRRRLQHRSAHRRELRISSPQTGGRFAPEFSVRFAPALSARISRA